LLTARERAVRRQLAGSGFDFQAPRTGATSYFVMGLAEWVIAT
jgi:hypothetical protein